MQHQDYQQAAQQLEQTNPLELEELERQTLSDELSKTAEPMTSEPLNDLAQATAAWQDAMTKNDQAAMSTAAQAMATQMRQQANRLEIESELDRFWLVWLRPRVNPAAAAATSINRRKIGQPLDAARPGDPIAEEQATIETTRQREELQARPALGRRNARRCRARKPKSCPGCEYQAKYDQYQRMAETVLRHEALPLGHRRTIRKYFESLRP